MLDFFVFNREGCKLLMVEVPVDFDPLELNGALYPKPQYPEIKGEGVAVYSNNQAIAMQAAMYYKNTCKWVGCLDLSRSHYINVTWSFDPEFMVGKTIKADVPCLECHRQGIEKIIHGSAKHPYCSEHRDRIPYRRKNRNKNKS